MFWKFAFLQHGCLAAKELMSDLIRIQSVEAHCAVRHTFMRESTIPVQISVFIAYIRI